MTASTFTPEAMAAIALRQAVGDAGGLASLAQLARRYGIARSSMGAIARERDFPLPIWRDDNDFRRVYAIGEVDAFIVARSRRRRLSGTAAQVNPSEEGAR